MHVVIYFGRCGCYRSLFRGKKVQKNNKTFVIDKCSFHSIYCRMNMFLFSPKTCNLLMLLHVFPLFLCTTASEIKHMFCKFTKYFHIQRKADLLSTNRKYLISMEILKITLKSTLWTFNIWKLHQLRSSVTNCLTFLANGKMFEEFEFQR